MRKADYHALADVIKNRISPDYEPFGKTLTAEQRKAWEKACRSIAVGFASRASVDRDAFLKACGID